MCFVQLSLALSDMSVRLCSLLSIPVKLPASALLSGIHLRAELIRVSGLGASAHSEVAGAQMRKCRDRLSARPAAEPRRSLLRRHRFASAQRRKEMRQVPLVVVDAQKIVRLSILILKAN